MTDALDPGYVPGRRRAEMRRRRKQRQRRMVALGLVVLLLATVGITYLLVQGAPEQTTEVEPQARTQRTLLFQVRGADGTAVASALIAHDDPSTTGAVVLVPPQVIVDVPGAGSVPFGQALATGDPTSSANALADLLGVTVDASWVLDEAGLMTLVDALGGLTVSVDVPVVVDNTVLVPQGTQRLDGARALALMTYLAEGEPEQARLARVQEVLDAVLEALPDDVAGIRAQLQALGEASRTSDPVAVLAELLAGLQEDSAAEQLQYDTLPVIPIDPGGGVTAFRVDAEQARALVDRALAQSVPSGARQSGNRVLVLNGVGTPGLGEAVRAKLVAADFVFVASRNAERFGYERTQILVPEATAEQQELGERVAAALGVPDAEVRQSNLGSLADVVVVVGADFVP